MAASTIKRARLKASDVSRILMEMDDDSDLSSLSDSEAEGKEHNVFHMLPLIHALLLY